MISRLSAVTFPFDARTISRITSRVMFCVPLRMREIEASLTPTEAAKSAEVGAFGAFRN